jgi:hypothetical protein
LPRSALIASLIRRSTISRLCSNASISSDCLPHQAIHDIAPVLAAEEEERVMASLMKHIGLQGFPMAILSHNTSDGKAYAIQ